MLFNDKDKAESFASKNSAEIFEEGSTYKVSISDCSFVFADDTEVNIIELINTEFNDMSARIPVFN